MEETVSQAELARRLDVSRKAVHSYVSRGLVEVDGEGQIDPEAAMDSLQEKMSPFKREDARQRKGDGVAAGATATAFEGMQAARLRTLEVSAQRQELRLQKDLGKVIFTDDAVAVQVEAAALVVRMIDLIPGWCDEIMAVARTGDIGALRAVLRGKSKDLRAATARAFEAGDDSESVNGD